MRLRYVVGRIQDGMVLLAKLLNVRILFLRQQLYILFADNRHRKRNWCLVQDRYFNHEFIFESNQYVIE